MPHLSPSLATAPSTPLIRPVVDEDAQEHLRPDVNLLAEYPGCFVDPHDDLPDLRAPSCLLRRFRRRLLGCRGRTRARLRLRGGRLPGNGGIAELHRLYVRPEHARAGIRLAVWCAGRKAMARQRRCGNASSCGPTRASRRPTGSTAVSAIRRPADERQLADISQSAGVSVREGAERTNGY